MSEQQPSSQDRQLAILAVLGRAGPARGAPPSEEEFVAYFENGLDEARREEVLSHVAADPDLYREWMLTAQALDLPADTKVTKFERRRRINTAGWITGALAAGVCAVWIAVTQVPSGSRTDSVDWQSWPTSSQLGVSRGPGVSVSSRMMIRHGFFSGTRASLPESPTALAFTHRLDRELADPKVCASPTPSNECLAGEHLGRWVTGAFITCAANAEDDRKVSDDQLRGLAEIVAELAPIADAEDLFLSAQALEVSLRATGHFTPDDCQKVRELIRQASQD